MNYIRFIISLLLIILINGCSIENDTNINNFYTDYIKFESVNLPVQLKLGQDEIIEYSYLKPSNCHDFGNLFYQGTQNSHSYIIVSTVITNGPNSCFELTEELIEGSFVFRPSNLQGQTFRFWNGVDEITGEDLYTEFEIPVVENN